jgi:hypothetical protein
MSNTPAPPEDQARLLEDALVAVRQQTALMRKCLETPGKLMDALKCWYVDFIYCMELYALQGATLHAIVSHKVAPLCGQLAAVLTPNLRVTQFSVSFRIAHE